MKKYLDSKTDTDIMKTFLTFRKFKCHFSGKAMGGFNETLCIYVKEDLTSH